MANQNEDLTGETPEGYIESFALRGEIDDLFVGLTFLGRQREEEGPISFDILRQNASRFGPSETHLLEAVNEYEEMYYTSSHDRIGYAQQDVARFYQGRRPTLEDFEEMLKAWKLAEEGEIHHIVANTIYTKYDKKNNDPSGVYMEMMDLDLFREPVSHALEGKAVVVRDFDITAADSNDPNDPSGVWYKINDIQFNVTE